MTLVKNLLFLFFFSLIDAAGILCDGFTPGEGDQTPEGNFVRCWYKTVARMSPDSRAIKAYFYVEIVFNKANYFILAGSGGGQYAPSAIAGSTKGGGSTTG